MLPTIPVSKILPLISLSSALLWAQVSSAPPPPATPIANTQQLEVEVIEAHNKIGIPTQIHRKPGKFILAVTNQSSDPNAWFVLAQVPAAASPAPVTAPTPVLSIGSALYERKHRSGAVFDAPAGTYQLKFGTTGVVLCTIVIQ